ncbi:RNA polymerase sigma factor [Paucisalibacillus sp. EB02]|uniref:RNA polymerase sigma factor n=1 Tax=Paucisalibacillus sp. EB02 TaxID=1347087 RepID=UPI0004B35683|nr:sigma-70 family RNA polymerase sigma factor [Paucisalibacillus sp. EB02]
MHEERLLQLLREKDLAAFAQLIDESKRLVETIVFQYGIEPNDVADVVLEIFHNFYQKIDRLEPGKLSVWLFQQTFKILKGYKDKITSKKEDLLTIEKQYGYYIENRRQMLLHACLRDIDSKSKQPLILNYFYNKSIEEISTILNTSVEATQTRLKRGEDLLKGKYENVIHQEVPYHHDERNLNEQLRELNYYYMCLPEFVDKQDILLRLEKIMASHKWKKILPTTIVIIGFLVFSIITVRYIQEENDKQAFLEQQETKEQEKQKEDISNPEDKQVKLDPEIVKHLDKAKETLKTELGMEDISELTSIQMIEIMLKEVKINNPDNEEFVRRHQIEYIDMQLTPPSIAKENLLNPDKRDEKFMTYLYTLTQYEGDFQEYLDSLLMEINVPIEDYEVLVSFQDDVTSYDGPNKIKDFMQTLNKQGHYLTRISENDKVSVLIDYLQVKNDVIEAGYNDGYLAYLELVIKHGNQYYQTDWKEDVDILLEFESLLTNYGHHYSKTFKEFIISEINANLYSLLWAGLRPLQEEDRQVYYQFLEENRDSVFWDIINTAVEEYEANEWMETIHPPDLTYVKALFDKRFGNITLANFDFVRRWPLETNSIVIYKELKENFDQSRLVDLSPLEMVSLYDYASGKDDNEVYNALWALKTLPDDEDLDFNELRRHSIEYVFTEYPSENNALVHLADWNLDHVTSIELIKENNIWQVAWIYKNNSSK